MLCSSTVTIARQSLAALRRALVSSGLMVKPLPQTPYGMAVWKKIKLHRDCYIRHYWK